MSVSTEARHIRNSSALPLFTRDHFKTRSQALIAHCGMSEIYHQTPPLRRGGGTTGAFDAFAPVSFQQRVHCTPPDEELSYKWLFFSPKISVLFLKGAFSV